MSKDKGFNMKNYNEKIINAFKYKKGLYTIPTRYEFSALAVDKKILEENKINIDDKNWTWNNFMDYARKLTKDKNGDGKIDQYALPKMKGSEIMQFLFLNGNYNFFIIIFHIKAFIFRNKITKIYKCFFIYIFVIWQSIHTYDI
ncbi:ABC transporter substrate-binding protein [Clostridium tetanomorphum DSM 665]|nr:ABC transporter substrate-binding protein [Clostridium tetanomorphum DSM 665]